MRRKHSIRRLLRFSLRSLLLVVTLSALAAILLGQVIRNYENEQQALARISEVSQLVHQNPVVNREKPNWHLIFKASKPNSHLTWWM